VSTLPHLLIGLALASDASCPISLDPGTHQRLDSQGQYGWHQVWIPEDFEPDTAWPVVLSYHGYSDNLRPNTAIMGAVTGGRGFVLVGMDYGSSRYYQGLGEPGLRSEVRRLHAVLDTLEHCLRVDRDAVFVGGYSQGGYAATNLAERILDELAGLIVLGAGRGWGDGHMPSRSAIQGFPVFIGAGEDDRPHGLRAEASAVVYAGWGATVSLERWPDTAHVPGWRWYQDAPERATNLREWLRENSEPRTD
jgi:predicted esterase